MTSLILCIFIILCTCIVIPVKAKEKGQYVSWLSNTTIVRQIIISGKLAFLIWGLFSHKIAQFKEKCSFLELFYLALNVVSHMLKISELDDTKLGGKLPYKPIQDVPFFRVSFLSINSWIGIKIDQKFQSWLWLFFKNKKAMFLDFL